MGSRRSMTAVAMVLGALAATSCSRKEASPDDAAPATSASAARQPWEPFDEGFRGCEGG
jgi:hypothetical protein